MFYMYVYFAANKSLMCGSAGTECTYFKTLEDHITQPVLFIPEAHLSTLQRLVGSSLILPSAPFLLPSFPPACRWSNRHERGSGGWRKTVGKYAVGKMFFLGARGCGVLMTPVKVKLNAGLRSDKLIGDETRHKFKPLQLALDPRHGRPHVLRALHSTQFQQQRSEGVVQTGQVSHTLELSLIRLSFCIGNKKTISTEREQRWTHLWLDSFRSYLCVSINVHV